MTRKSLFVLALGLLATPVGAAQVYTISFETSSGYSGSFGLDPTTDTLVAADFIQGGRVWTLPDLVLYSSYVGNGVYYLIGGKPNGLSIQISPVAANLAENDFSLSFTLLFGSPRQAQGGTLQVQTAGAGYSVADAMVKAVAVPEAGSWALMSLGFGLFGYAMRKHRGLIAAV